METQKTPEPTKGKTQIALSERPYLIEVNQSESSINVKLSPINFGYPEIFQNGYTESTPNPGGGENIFFG
ncbi:MAG: hypothetical protein WCT42_00980 [Candidatus Paceibacterota bacterium]